MRALLVFSLVVVACSDPKPPAPPGPQPVFDHATGKATPPPEWTACTKDTECVALSVECCYQMAIRKEYELETRKTLESGKHPPKEGGCEGKCDPTALCVDARCALK